MHVCVCARACVYVHAYLPGEKFHLITTRVLFTCPLHKELISAFHFREGRTLERFFQVMTARTSCSRRKDWLLPVQQWQNHLAVVVHEHILVVRQVLRPANNYTKQYYYLVRACAMTQCLIIYLRNLGWLNIQLCPRISTSITLLQLWHARTMGTLDPYDFTSVRIFDS